ncbi:MAG: SIS domain-containing protein [Myxococcota bacterium]
MNFSAEFVALARQALDQLDCDSIERVVDELVLLRDRGGRLFVLGVGGSAANASHAVNDFRKLCGVEAYTPTDNVAELTARTNDEGWESTFAAWLRTSRLNARDVVMVLSVGGGDRERNVSPNLVAALEAAADSGAPVVAIVGRDGGAARRSARCTVLVPTVDATLVTPITEAFQSVVLHLLVSHPRLQRNATKW